jgi:hypothetical protein
MKTNIEINGQTEEVILNILPAGYGHWNITAYFYHNGERVESIYKTNDSHTIDAMRSDDEDKSEKVIQSVAEGMVAKYLEAIN